MSFKSWLSYSEFASKTSARPQDPLDNDSREFLASILDTCKTKVRKLSAGTIVWRAQAGSHNVASPDFHIDERVPYTFKRMKPDAEHSSDGRANTKGIPCLYVAADAETAIHEIRPWPSLVVSLGKFKLVRELKFIDFSESSDSKQFPYFFFNEPSADEIIKAVWAAMDFAFSWPVAKSDSKSEYVPTQIISELIKSKGYDGIIYKSSIAKGRNYVLFNLNDAEVIQCDLFEVTKVKFDFEKLY
ncbi:RES family NAD+ phosphorylase [Pseudocolwellia agarivorans]|uniref:RES family NAD+ phosphorylase n=1 Tax=Pseudocolwellia agarivorans TaxID=1911682 RepID=UPI0009848BEA|nr:RES family NAD+ phosphorylase [Pseudocolwellia agarivorans]